MYPNAPFFGLVYGRKRTTGATPDYGTPEWDAYVADVKNTDLARSEQQQQTQQTQQNQGNTLDSVLQTLNQLGNNRNTTPPTPTPTTPPTPPRDTVPASYTPVNFTGPQTTTPTTQAQESSYILPLAIGAGALLLYMNK